MTPEREQTASEKGKGEREMEKGGQVFLAAIRPAGELGKKISSCLGRVS